MRVLVLTGLATWLLTIVPARAAETPAVCTFDAGALPADTLPAGSLHGDQIPLDHIVIMMQENRSFDHYFGQLHAKSGPPAHASNPDPVTGKPIRRFHQRHYCEVADLAHSWKNSHIEWDGGKNDGFPAANADPKDPNGHRTMGYYTARDLPFYYKLYKTFATGDRYFCALLGPTFPNRFYLLAGTSFGFTNNVIPDLSGPLYTQRSIFNLLDEHVPPITWKIYDAQLPFGGLFSYVRTTDLAHLAPIDQFFADAAAGTLPQVAYVDPIFLGKANVESDEHPPSNVQVGEQLVAKVIGALTASSAWPRSAMFLTYDEHGGFYDHVPPPPACVPDDVAPMLDPDDPPGAFDRYGFRVPVVVVSPYARKHFVSHVTHDHTSILRFVETRFDLPALTRRDANADPMLEFFDFGHASFTTPPRLPKAPLKAAEVKACDSAPSNGEF